MMRLLILKIQNNRYFRLFYRHGRPTKLLFVVCCFALSWCVVHPSFSSAEAIDTSPIIDAANQAIEDSKSTAAALWKTYFFPPSATYKMILYLASIMAGIMLVFNLGKWMTIENDDDAIAQVKKDMVWVLVLIIALTLDGQLSASMMYVEKSMADSVIDQLSTLTKAELKFREAQVYANLDDTIAPLFKACEGLVGQEQIQCHTNAYNTASSTLDDFEQLFGKNLWLQRRRRRMVSFGEYILDPQKSVGDKIATGFWTVTAPAWEGAVKVISSAFATGVFNLIDCLVIFMSLVAPLAAAFSLLPVSGYSKSLILHQVMFLALYGWKLVIIMLDAISSEILTSSNADLDTIWFGVVTGLAFPLLSLAGVFFAATNFFRTLSDFGNKLFGKQQQASSNVSKVGGGDSGASSSPPPRSRNSRAELVR